MSTTVPSTGIHAAGRHDRQELARDAKQRGQRWFEIDVTGGDRRTALKAIGAALDFPIHYGANLDALRDCLADLPDHDASRGWTILLIGVPEADRDALLEVFRVAADELRDRGRELRVFYR